MGLKVTEIGHDIVISGEENFILKDTLDCGQAFRWKADEKGVWSGIAGGRYLELYEGKNGEIILKNTTISEYNSFWKAYFDLDRDYSKIITEISTNETLKNAAEFGKGIRILRQEPFEAVVSFIISQNNNIPRIKGIIERLCENFGEKTDGGYLFPTAECLAGLSVEDLAPIRSGFRAKYIIDAAQKYAHREINEHILLNGEIDSARAELEKIKGVGPKVADCALLFGYGRIEAFPRDVWIKRAIEVLFQGKLPPEADRYAGVVQQYIFNYARVTKLEI